MRACSSVTGSITSAASRTRSSKAPLAVSQTVDADRGLEPVGSRGPSRPRLRDTGGVGGGILLVEQDGQETPEARLAKALDKLETILQHTQGDNPANFDYRFNLDYGREYTAGDPLIVALRRTLDEETERLAERREAEADS